MQFELRELLEEYYFITYHSYCYHFGRRFLLSFFFNYGHLVHPSDCHDHGAILNVQSINKLTPYKYVPSLCYKSYNINSKHHLNDNMCYNSINSNISFRAIGLALLVRLGPLFDISESRPGEHLHPIIWDSVWISRIFCIFWTVMAALVIFECPMSHSDMLGRQEHEDLGHQKERRDNKDESSNNKIGNDVQSMTKSESIKKRSSCGASERIEDMKMDNTSQTKSKKRSTDRTMDRKKTTDYSKATENLGSMRSDSSVLFDAVVARSDSVRSDNCSVVMINLMKLGIVVCHAILCVALCFALGQTVSLHVRNIWEYCGKLGTLSSLRDMTKKICITIRAIVMMIQMPLFQFQFR